MREITNTKNLPKGITRRQDGCYMGRFQYEGQRYTLYDENADILLTRIEDINMNCGIGFINESRISHWINGFILGWRNIKSRQ